MMSPRHFRYEFNALQSLSQLLFLYVDPNKNLTGICSNEASLLWYLKVVTICTIENISQQYAELIYARPNKRNFNGRYMQDRQMTIWAY